MTRWMIFLRQSHLIADSAILLLLALHLHPNASGPRTNIMGEDTPNLPTVHIRLLHELGLHTRLVLLRLFQLESRRHKYKYHTTPSQRLHLQNLRDEAVAPQLSTTLS
jgi:hypothetical protein